MLFYYEAKNKQGEKVTGVLKAKNERELAWQLKQDALLPIKIEKKEAGTDDFFAKSGSGDNDDGVGIVLFKKVSAVDKLMFTQHLSVMIKGGVSIAEGVSILANQTKSRYFKRVLLDAGKKIVKGVSLSEALGDYPKVFSSVYLGMVEIGETIGNLDEVLELLALQLKKEYELKSKVKGAMTYPLVVVVAMLIVGILMMTLVVPKVMVIFEELQLDLPFTTQMIVNMSKFLQNHVWAVIISIPLAGFLGGFLLRVEAIKKIFHYLFLKIPFLKEIIRKVNTAYFCRSFSSMLNGGVPIVRVLEISSGSVGNYFFQKAIKRAAKEVKTGIALNVVLKDYSDIFPDLLVQMVRIGEETGMSVKILKQLAEFYENEVDNLTKNMSSIIEPILMIVVGSVVGFFAVSMLQPMYSIMEQIQ